MFAKNIMTTNVITVGPDTPILEIATLLSKHGISAVPVINQHDQVVGIVSEGDLVPTLKSRHGPRRSWWLELFGDQNKPNNDGRHLDRETAKDVMTRDVISADYFSTIPSIAELLEKNHIKRVPVINHGKLIGIVSRANLVQFLALQNQDSLREVFEEDEIIRQNLIDEIQKNEWSKLSMLNVLVNNGVVTFWGLVKSEEIKELLQSAAEQMPGVNSVEANMGISTLLDV